MVKFSGSIWKAEVRFSINSDKMNVERKDFVMLEILKAILFGVVEGITEWLPISSTGHMILLDEFVKLDVSPEFLDLFLVVIQLGAILAVVVLYFKKLIPFSRYHGRVRLDGKKCSMWLKIIVASIPAGVVGILWDDVFTELFYNYWTVAIMLILVGIVFIIVENANRGRIAEVDSIDDISYGKAFLIGVFQMIAAVFPGTSRSGSTIVGSLMLGISRTAAAEFTFFLAIPAMFGGSAIKLLKFEGSFNGSELMLLVIGMVVAFVVSIIAIKFLMSYIKKHDFKVFGWYRIVLGAAVIGYFLLKH